MILIQLLQIPHLAKLPIFLEKIACLFNLFCPSSYTFPQMVTTIFVHLKISKIYPPIQDIPAFDLIKKMLENPSYFLLNTKQIYLQILLNLYSNNPFFYSSTWQWFHPIFLSYTKILGNSTIFLHRLSSNFLLYLLWSTLLPTLSILGFIYISYSFSLQSGCSHSCICLIPFVIKNKFWWQYTFCGAMPTQLYSLADYWKVFTIFSKFWL